MVTNEQIVREWFKHDRSDSVAKALGMSVAALLARVKKLRAAGVRIPKKRGVPAIDVDALNRIVDVIGPPLNGKPAEAPVAEETGVAAHADYQASARSQRTRLLAETLQRRGEQQLSALAKATGLTLDTVTVLVRQKYFEVNAGQVDLSPVGRSEILGKSDG